MISKRFPWKIFWLGYSAQIAIFYCFYGATLFFAWADWNLTLVLMVTLSSLISSLIFIRPVVSLVVSLKEQKAELHREREESQAFLSSIQEAVVSFNLEKKIIFYNIRFAAMFLSSHLKTQFIDIDQIFTQAELLKAIKGILSDGHSRKVTLKIPTLYDGQQRFFNISLTPVHKRKNKEFYEVVAVFHDISDIKKAEEIRIDFVGNASHELRTPLTSIKGYVETLREDLQNQRFDQVDRFIGIVSRNVDRLIDLVNDLLSLSQLESSADLKIQKVAPLQLTQMVLSELALLAQEKNIVIKSSCRVDEMKADGQKVEQVLRNLLSNAIKYIPEGKEVQVRWESDDNLVFLRVIDNGPGISEEHHQRLFERFYRIDRGRSRETGGTGLGLAITKYIMQAHGGSIEVKSSPGQGAEFICRFPQIGS